MSALLLLAMEGNAAMASSLAAKLGGVSGSVETRKFPDGETYLRLAADFSGRSVALVCSLDHPDAKFLPLVFAADAARDLGAASVGLVAPYLAYMRQDRRFQAGEAVTSRSFAKALSQNFDWLVTIDPHLHRTRSLGELYSIPAEALHAAPLLADWVGSNVENPLLVGPDGESVQWVSAAAARIKAPFTVLDKICEGDREVEIRLTDAKAFGNRTPVLLDDIISSGETMLAAVRAVRRASDVRPVCVAVHGIFADRADEALAREGARVVTANTVPHATNAIDVSGLLADGVAALLQGG